MRPVFHLSSISKISASVYTMHTCIPLKVRGRGGRRMGTQKNFVMFFFCFFFFLYILFLLIFKVYIVYIVYIKRKPFENIWNESTPEHMLPFCRKKAYIGVYTGYAWSQVHQKVRPVFHLGHFKCIRECENPLKIYGMRALPSTCCRFVMHGLKCIKKCMMCRTARCECARMA